MASGEVLEVIEGSCLEVGVFDPSIFKTGRLAHYQLMFSWLLYTCLTPQHPWHTPSRGSGFVQAEEADERGTLEVRPAAAKRHDRFTSRSGKSAFFSLGSKNEVAARRHRLSAASRDFVPWRFSDAGPERGDTSSLAIVRETCTTADVQQNLGNDRVADNASRSQRLRGFTCGRN
jgi:hypothetical protein